MIRSRTIALIATAMIFAPAATQAAGPELAPGALVAVGDTRRFSLRARAVSPDSLRVNVRAQTGLTIVAPGDSVEPSITVEFPDLPARDGVARIGAALGGFVPLRAVWTRTTRDGRQRTEEEYYLVRPGSRRRQLLEACALTQGGVVHRQLFELLKGEGAAIVPDATEIARDSTRSEGERVLAISLLGTLGVPEAVAVLAGILRDDAAALAREAAAVALGTAGKPAILPDLKRALADAEPQVALSAAWALVRFGDPSGVPLALAHLRDTRVDRAFRALDVVAASADARHIPALEAALAGTRGPTLARMRTTIAGLAMAGLDEPGKVAACERLLGDADLEVRRYGADALARIGTPAAAAALARAAADPSRDGAREAGDAATRLRLSSAPPPQVTID